MAIDDSIRPANARVLITGGAGFIGSSTARRLIDGNEVAIFDNLNRNAMQYTLAGHGDRVKVYRGDVTEIDEIRAALADWKPNYIVHCAAVAGIDTVVREPVTTLEVNLLGTSNLLRAALDLPDLRRVVCFSSSEIFGPQAYNSNERTSAVIGVVGEARWSYAVSKLAGEHLALAYWMQHKMPTVVLRPFNVYGPGQVGEGALSTFVQRAIRDEPIQIHGDGNQIRAWCYIDDMVNGVLKAAAHPNAVGKAFNIGNPRAVTTVYGLASTVIRVLGARSRIEFVRKDYADIELRVPDPSWARQEIDFSAAIDLEEGILRTAEYYRSLPANR